MGRLEKEVKKSEDKTKQLDLKISSLIEEIDNLKKEYDSLKISAGAGNLLLQEKEDNYKEEIKKLKGQIDRLTEGSGETLK